MTAETHNSAPMIYPAMAAIMAEIPAIGKDKKNQQQGFNYRGIDDVYNALNGIMAKHGVFICPEVLDQSREERATKSGGVMGFVTLRIKYVFYAKDGSSVSCVVCGEGMDSGDKATSKAMSIAQKYAFFQVFTIPTKEAAESDPDKDAHQLAPKPKNQNGRASSGQAADNDRTATGQITDAQRRNLYAVISETAPHIKGDREVFLQVLSMVFTREISSTNDLTSGEASTLISDPSLIKQFAPTEAEYKTILANRSALIAECESLCLDRKLPLDDLLIETFPGVKKADLTTRQWEKFRSTLLI